MARRSFLAASAVTAASSARVMGANDRIRIAVIGAGGRGQYLMKELNKTGEAEWVAVCDVYDVRRNQAAQIAGGAVEQYLDYKQVLARKDIDAVIVATPDHWHGQITVEALKSGKDVYVEKPMVHYPKDGQAIVKAARENKRIVQVGTQGRLLPHYVEAKERFIDTGAMGKIGLARTWYNGNRGYILKPPDGMEKKPDGLDWDRWTGPQGKVPWNPEMYFSPYKWMNYDGGMIMGIGIHVIDNAHHFLGLTKPRAAMSGGGIYHYNDRDSADVVTCIIDYPEKVTVTFEAECLTCPGVRETGGVELRGTGGVLTTQRYITGPNDTAFEYVPNPQFSKVAAAKGPGTSQTPERILRNWLDSMRSRKRPVANEEVAYWSTLACFMANEAYKKRARIDWNPAWDLPA